MSVVAVIPCYNEEMFIGDIVFRVKKYVDRVIVSNDCSTDCTENIAVSSGAVVVGHQNRRGFGGNLICGISAALATGGEDIIVTLDGDAQHKPEEIPLLMKSMDDTGADIVIGSRFLQSYKCPAYRKFGIDIITWLYNAGCSEKITDAQSCLRAYRRKLFDSVRLEDCGFGISTEVLIKARRSGFVIKEVPISCIYHPHGKWNSTMNPVKHGLSVAFATIRWRLTR